MKVAVTSRSFSRNKELCDSLVSLYPDTKFNTEGINLSGEQLVDFLAGFDAAIIALEKIDRDVLKSLPNLKVISKYGVGLNNLDFDALREFDVKLGWKPGVNKRSVSELTLCMAIDMLRCINIGNSLVKSGDWKQVVGRQLTGKTYGILGLGNVGQDLVKLLKPFGCKLLANDIADRSQFAKENNVKMVSLDEIFRESDVISIHVPLDDSTDSFIKKDLLSLMKEDSVLINTARGGIVSEKNLYEILLERKQMIAAFDVLEFEPPKNSNLIDLDNFYITPHIGGSAREAILAMGKSAIEGLSDCKPMEFYEN